MSKRAAGDTGPTLLRQVEISIAVLGLHVGMLLLFIHVTSATRTPITQSADSTSSIIVLRLLPSVAKPPHETASPKAATAVNVAKPRTHVSKMLPPTTGITTVTPVPPALTPPRAQVNAINWNMSRATPSSTDSFSSRLKAAANPRPITHLPGSSVAVVKGLRMTDPRNQGIAGVARTLQALLGVPNHHCIDVDAWRQLSMQELLDRHMSPSDVDKTAAEYGCNAPNR